MTRTEPLAILLLWPFLAGAQGPPRRPTFQAGVEVVRLSVSVTDGRNRYVTDLSEDDFGVFEDGVRQRLALFSREQLPISLVLLIDCSGSMDDKLPVAQSAATGFIRTLRREDLAQVVQFNERMAILEDFTADQGALETAIQRIRASGATGLYNALYITLREFGGAAEGRTLRRRAIVLLSDGEDTASLVSDEQVLELARRKEIPIYAISLRPDRPQDRLRMAHNEAAYFIHTLARLTGGQPYFPGALFQLDAVYGRIAEELRTQYTLGYVPVNPRRDGKWRQIVVRTPSRDNLYVRHKVGYYEPASLAASAGQ
jgi:Ca-activated chloride channel family protein